MLKLTAYLCILGYLLTPAFAQQQLFYPLPQTASKPASSNPWGLKPLSKLPATKPATQPAQQYRPPYYPPPPPTYLPSQLNPNAGTNQNFGQNYNPQNYNPQNSAKPASTSDTWGSWKNNGGAFRYSPGVDFSSTYGDVVVALNSMGTTKIKTVGPTGTSSWVTLAQPLSGNVIEGRPSISVSPGGFLVFARSATAAMYMLSSAGTLPLSQLTVKTWTAMGGGTYKDPASVFLGSSYYVFIIGGDGKVYIYIVSTASTPVVTAAAAFLEATPKLFTFSPAAATYMSNGVGRVVVAAVTYDGTLNIYDSIVDTAASPALVASAFAPTDVSCIDSPQAVGLGDHVEVYCRGKDMQFYCVTIMQGGVGDTRILPEADLPDVFKPVFNSMTNTVTVYSKSPAGRVISKPFQNYSPVSYWK